MKDLPIIELKVNQWSRITREEQVKAAWWLKKLINDLLDMDARVDDEFTGEYP